MVSASGSIEGVVVDKTLQLPIRSSSEQSPLFSPGWTSEATTPASLGSDHHPLSQLSSQSGSAQTVSPRYYSPSLNPDHASDWISDLELMHHYSTSTFCTFPASQGALEMFRMEMPRVALSHPYLMHQILALSALHLAELRPNLHTAYFQRATRHQNLSISGMRMELSGSVTKSNCQALFASSAMLMASTYASRRYTPVTSDCSPIDDMLEIFSLLRGVGLILNMSGEALLNGSSRHLFTQIMPDADDISFLHSVANHLWSLQSRAIAAADISQDVQQIAASGISTLVQCLIQIPPKTRTMATVELRTVFLWPQLLSHDFLDLLRRREPMMMAIFVHYCVVLQAVESDVWFIRGWSLKIAEYAWGLLSDTTPWAELVSWALGKIRGDLALDQRYEDDRQHEDHARNF